MTGKTVDSSIITGVTGIQPWHRQFWPWFLIILPGIVVIASLITVVIAFRKADTLVADNYYKEGLAINQTVADINNARTLKIHATLDMTTSSIHLHVTPDNITEQTLMLNFNHPLDKEQDISLPLVNAGNGEYHTQLPPLHSGKWYITLQSVSAEMPWRINTTAWLPATQITFNAQ